MVGRNEIGGDVRLGRLAVDSGMLERTDLDGALAMQRILRRAGLGDRLGAILVERGHLDRATVEGLLSTQASRTGQPVGPVGSIRLTADQNRDLLKALWKERSISRPEVSRSLAIQRALSRQGIERSVGEVLVGRGLVGRLTVERVLGCDLGFRPIDCEEATVPLFGRVAIAMGAASALAVRTGLRVQAILREAGGRVAIGDVLLDRGDLDRADIDRILAEQDRRRRRVRWSMVARIDDLPAEDRARARDLVWANRAGGESIGRATHVRRALAAMGMEIDLADVLSAFDRPAAN